MLHRRRLRPAQRRLRGRRGGADRARGQASGQADLVARGGHRAGPVPAAVVPVPGGGDGLDRQGQRLEALRDRRRRRRCIGDRRHEYPLLRRAEPADRTARRLARRAGQALARRGPRVQRLRHRELHRPDGGGREHGSDPVQVRAHGRHAQGTQVLRDRGADVRLEGRASGWAGDRTVDLGALGLTRRRRGRDFAQPPDRQDQGPQGVGGGRWRHHRQSGAGQGQHRERDHLRAFECAARTRHAQGRRRGAVELPRLQPDAHV